MRDTGSKRWGLTQTHAARLGILAVLVAAMFALTGASAEAAYIHPASAYEFGPDGLATSAFPGSGSVAEMDYDQSSKRIFMLDKSDGKVYAINFAGPGSYSAAGSPYPLTVGSAGCCTDIGIDNTSGATAEYLYYSPDGAPLYGFTSAGAPLPAFAPESGEKCGAAVDNEGHFWSGNFSTRKMEEFEPTGGAPIATVDVSGTGLPCRVRFDLSNNDMYVSQYSGQGAVRYTAASGYSAASAQVFDTTTNSNIAINATRHVVYVAGRSKVSAYDTVTGSLLESFGEESGCFINGIAVDDATDTVFLSRSCTNRIQEWKGAVVPDAVTGEPTGNTTVSGSVALAGGGEVTGCEFQFGTSTEYGQSEPCSPAAPYNADQPLVTADLKEDLEGETTYHYRLVASNANGTAKGVDKTITPHNVKGLHTEPATDITQESATLNAGFEGTNEDTHYYFEWGRSTAYGRVTSLPPGEDAGTTSGPTSISARLTALKPGGTYHYRVVAENGMGLSKATDQQFTTHDLPAIESFKSAHVTETTADIEARIDSNGFDTTYQVEYGPTTSYGSIAPVPAAVLSAGTTAEGVSVHLEHLEGVTYHFRVVAENTWGTTTTGDQTFNFFPPTCPNATLRQQTGSDFLPDCRAYELVSPSDTGNVVLTGVNPAPLATYASSPTRFAYTGFWGAIPGFDTINNSFDVYVATRTPQGWVNQYVGLRGYEALSATIPSGNGDLSKFLDFKGGFGGGSTPIPFAWDVDNNFLGRWPMAPEAVPGGNGESQLGAYQPSPDYSHLAFSSNNIAFDSEGQGLTTAPGSAYDYDTATGSIELISRTASGDIPQEPGNTSRANEFIKFPPSPNGRPSRIYQGISTDGSHILMSTTSAPGSESGRLYMRVDDGMTWEVSQGHAVTYVGMTRDASQVFFSSTDQLTPDDSDDSDDLFAWREATDTIERISVGSEGTGNGDSCTASWTEKCNAVAVEGQLDTDNSVSGNSGDVYFYSPEVLAGPENGVENAQNLYVFRNGQVTFVASLPSTGSGALERIQVSPDGARAAFVTTARLTAYNNAGHSEMYSYDLANHEVLCVSCNPSGTAAVSNVEASMNGIFMSDDGRTFWSTTESLVPQDSNKVRDVYEYTENRPQLISSGTGDLDGRGPEERFRSGLSGVSANGVNAYFSTYDSLVAQDNNGPFLKFYDARVGGGIPAPPAPTPCVAADECHEPTVGAPNASVIVSEGNLGAGGNVIKPSHKRKAKRGRKHRKHRRARRRRHVKHRRIQAHG